MELYWGIEDSVLSPILLQRLETEDTYFPSLIQLHNFLGEHHPPYVQADVYDSVDEWEDLPMRT
jgi:hypothetical protein